jgi:cobalt-zinc-cadmium resistance protein CzcA
VLNVIIDFSLRNRLLVILGALGFAALGGLALAHLPLDAFPDTTPVQVQINTVATALGPEEVEQQITFPIEQALGTLPRIEGLRSTSQFGLSQVIVTFADGTDIYFGRQVVNERLGTVTLPPGIDRPRLGPVATGLGEVFHYAVYSAEDLSKLSEAERVKKLTELRTVHDWVIRPRMRTVKGVAEINSWGGHEKQFQVRARPDKLFKYNLTLDQVVEALDKNNRIAGGGYVRRTGEVLLVRGVARTADVGQIGDVVVAAQGGVPIKIRDLADVEVGYDIRRGAVSADGKGEIVLGLGFMLMGENSHEVTTALKEKLKEIKPLLPAGVRVEILYDRTELVGHVIHTVRNNLLEAGLLVIAVLFLFLGNLRAALIVALAIPLSLLFAFSGMYRFGIAASLLSLGAVDFGMVVDSSVVMVENCVRHLAHGDARTRPRLEVIRDAALEVRKPTMFGELIIMIVYLPILTLEGIEGKLFRPMALTVIFALAGSMVLSLTLMPALASLLIPRHVQEREPLLMRLAQRAYAPLLRFATHHKAAVLLLAVALLGFAVLIARGLGGEFVPRLSEGALVAELWRLPGTSLPESVRANTLIEKAILEEFPNEVAHIWSRMGTAEVATDPMLLGQGDMFIALKPREQWRKARTQEELTGKIDELVREFPGVNMDFEQPIEQRVNEMISGVRTDVAVKVFGDDLKVLKETAARIKGILGTVSGNKDPRFEVKPQPVLQVKVRQDELARYGVPAKTVLDLVEALGGLHVGEVVQGQYRFPLAVRLPETFRRNPTALRELQVTTPAGERIPLGRLAEVRVLEDVPAMIDREWGQRQIKIKVNVRGRDVAGFVAEAQGKVARDVPLPPGGRYHIEWGGQFEHLTSATRRLYVVVPVALLLIFVLLYMTYGNFVDALRVFTAIPFAAVGGVVALWLRGMDFSISAGIGFIAMSGVAVLDDMILVSYIRQLRRKGVPVEEAVTQSGVTRLRPVLMTTLVASLGFLPMAFSTGMGAEVQRPLATVVIGGVISAMIMSLLVNRVLYLVVDRIAAFFRRSLAKLFRVRPEDLSWLFGEHAKSEAPAAPVAEERPTKEPVAIP